jgi:ATP-binding cassette, subfamily B, multidrug efflux pump
MAIQQRLDHSDTVISRGAMASLFALLSLGRTVYGYLILSLILVVGSSLAVVGSGMVIGHVLEIVRGNAKGESVWYWGGLFVLCEFLTVTLRFCGKYGLCWCTNRITQLTRCALAEKLTSLPVLYFDHHPSGRTITRLTTDVEGVESFFNSSLPRLVSSVIEIAVVLTAMVLFNVQIGLICVATALPPIGLIFAFRKPVRRSLELQKKQSAMLNSRLAEYIKGMEVLRSLTAIGWMQGDYERLCRDHRDSVYRQMHWNAFLRPVTIFLCALPVAVVFWVGGQQVIAGTLSLGAFVAFVRYSERFLSPIRILSQEVQVIQSALTSCDRVVQLLEESQEMRPSAGIQRDDLVLEGGIEFRNVCMTYDGTSQILNGVSFNILPGMTVGLVGATGAGKSSIINLIPSLYQPSGGEILLDGIPMSAIDIRCLRRQIAYIGQDGALFSGTIAENLLGYPGAFIAPESRKRMEEICHQIGLAPALARISKGLDGEVDEGGGNFSAGERQLIGFGRLLLRDPRILLMDEATASVDPQAEAMIQTALSTVCHGRTAIIIAHRLHTVRHCDLILVASEGRIVESGTHDSLLQFSGIYRELCSKQFADSWT